MNTTYIFIIIAALLIIWCVYGYFSSRVETTPYTVVASRNGYEIRLYPEHLVAQTTITGTYRDALNSGFRIVAGYIFGGNTRNEKIAMTAPVIEGKSSSEKIAMTAPVTTTLDGDARTVTFGMPQSYTRETLPVPTDSRVQIVTIPEKKMAALRFSWFRTDARVAAKKQELLDLLKKDGTPISGEVQYAGYNAPWTPPWMNRNEVLVEVKL